jgi:hypothetical protein
LRRRALKASPHSTEIGQSSSAARQRRARPQGKVTRMHGAKLQSAIQIRYTAAETAAALLHQGHRAG